MIQKVFSAFFPYSELKKNYLRFHVLIKCLVLENSLQNPNNITQRFVHYCQLMKQNGKLAKYWWLKLSIRWTQFSGLFLKLCLVWYNLDLRLGYRKVTHCCRAGTVLLPSHLIIEISRLLDFSQSCSNSVTLPFMRMAGRGEAGYLSPAEVHSQKNSKKYHSLSKKECIWNLPLPCLLNRHVKLREPPPITKDNLWDSFC